MPRLFAILLWFLALSTLALFASARWWLPEAVSTHAGAIDRQFKITIVIMGVAFVILHALLGLVVWRYRRRNEEQAVYSRGNVAVEIALAVLVAAVFLFLSVTDRRVWAGLRLNRGAAEAIQVEVVGQQFIWNFRYPGVDNRFGRSDPRLYNDEDNSIGARPGPLGIDPKDPSGNDDVVSTGVMVVPVNRPIRVLLRAKDVTHDFYVPALRLKQDAVPGMKIEIYFTATRLGRYEIACAELCGLLHHQMRAYLDVRSEEEFENWLRSKR